MDTSASQSLSAKDLISSLHDIMLLSVNNLYLPSIMCHAYRGCSKTRNAETRNWK